MHIKKISINYIKSTLKLCDWTRHKHERHFDKKTMFVKHVKNIKCIQYFPFMYDNFVVGSVCFIPSIVLINTIHTLCGNCGNGKNWTDTQDFYRHWFLSLQMYWKKAYTFRFGVFECKTCVIAHDDLN